MAQSIFGTDYAVTALNRAFNNASPSNAVFQSQKATAGTSEQQNMAFAEQFGAQFANVSDAALAKQVLTNLGVLPSTNEDVLALETELAEYFGIVSNGLGADARGIVVLQLATILSGLENATGDQAVYASAAKAWNMEVTQSFQYSANPSSTAPFNGDFPADNPGNPGNPGQTFTLTDKIGESVIGTVGNDTFKAVLGAIGQASDSTLNLGDSIDGGAGTDTLNLIMTGTNTAFPGGVTVKDVEIVNIDVTGAAAAANAATLRASNFTGVKELWQIDNAAGGGTFANVTVASGVVAGFASTGNKASAQVATASADFGAAATAGTIALKGVADTSAVAFAGAKLEAVTVNGNVTQNASSSANTLTVVTAGQETALNLGLTSATTVTVTDTGSTLKSVNTSAGTGNITADLTSLTKLVSFKGGAAAEKITLDVEGAGSSKATTVDLGAGNDTLILKSVAATANIEGTKITLGAGKDTLIIDTVGNINDASEANFAKGIIEVADFAKADDVLNLNSKGIALNAAQLDTIKGQSSLFAAVNEAAKLTNGASETTVAFSYGSDTYVLIDADNNGFDGGDGLIKLTGVSAYDLTNVQNGNLVL